MGFSRVNKMVLAAAFLMFGGATESTLWGTTPLCGTPLATYPAATGATAYSNGPRVAGGRNYQGTGTSCGTGDNYECVEYVKRFYITVLGISSAVSWKGNAISYFNNASAKGLDAFPNGGLIRPQPNDIVVFQGGKYGHVAIVTAIYADHVSIIEQNWSPTGTADLPRDPSVSPGYSLLPRGSKHPYVVLGWLRSNTSVTTAGTYRVIDIGLPLSAMNSSAHVVGGSTLWTANAGTTTLPFSNSCSWSALGINDVGSIVGNAFCNGPRGNSTAFIYQDGAPVFISDPSRSDASTQASAVNNSGFVIGYSNSLSCPFRLAPGIILSAAACIPSAPTPNSTLSIASGINAAGHVVGSLTVPLNSWPWLFSDVFLYDGTVTHDLGRGVGNDLIASGMSINDSDVVVGYSYTPSLSSGLVPDDAFYYDSSGSAHDLGFVSCCWPQPVSTSINKFGNIVGTERLVFPSVPGYSSLAYIWTPTKGMVDLNTLIPAGSGWHLTDAKVINDYGQILAAGTLNGVSHGCLLIPQ
jgi:surface antigen